MKALAAVAAKLAPGPFLRPAGPPEALPGWVVELPVPEPARLLLAILWRWRTTKRLVNPSIATLSKLMGRNERTVQRYLALLEGRPSAHEKDVPRPARQYVMRVYNAGRGRQCLYYLVPPGKLPHQAPAWPSTANFGGLRMGRFAIKRHRLDTQQNPDPRITLKGDHTSYDQRDERETKSAAAIRTQETASPPNPPSGGTSVRTLTAVNTTSPTSPANDLGSWKENELHSSPHSSQRDAPAKRPSKHSTCESARESRAQSPATLRLVFTKPVPVSGTLWRTAWAHWRQAHRDYFRIEPFPDVRDGRAMLGLIHQAMRAAKNNPTEVIRLLVWGFRRHCRAAGSPREASLCRLRRIRHEYGWPKPGWQPPTKAESTRSTSESGTSKPTSTQTPAEQAGSWEEKELGRYRAQLDALSRAPSALVSAKSLDALRMVIQRLEERLQRLQRERENDLK